MDRGAWWATIHRTSGVRHYWATVTFTISVPRRISKCWMVAWRIPGMGESGGLPSMGSHRVGHDWSDLAAAAAAPKYSRCTEWVLERLIAFIKVTQLIRVKAKIQESLLSTWINEWIISTLVLLSFPLSFFSYHLPAFFYLISIFKAPWVPQWLRW